MSTVRCHIDLKKHPVINVVYLFGTVVIYHSVCQSGDVACEPGCPGRG